MKFASLVLAVSMFGCATTGGRVSAGLAGATGTAMVLNTFRTLGCEDEDGACRDRIRNEGLVLAGVTAAAIITAIVFEAKARPDPRQSAAILKLRSDPFVVVRE